MMAVLPRRGGKNKISLRVYLSENVHTHSLAGYKTVSLRSIDGERPPHRNALRCKTIRELLFQFFLGGPADLICGLPKIATGNENHFLYREANMKS
jgi:hypothetical protein